jgi:hypothetical protein
MASIYAETNEKQALLILPRTLWRRIVFGNGRARHLIRGDKCRFAVARLAVVSVVLRRVVKSGCNFRGCFAMTDFSFSARLKFFKRIGQIAQLVAL